MPRMHFEARRYPADLCLTLTLTLTLTLAASRATLQAHAEDIELHARLRQFPEECERELHEGTNCVPRMHFEA